MLDELALDFITQGTIFLQQGAHIFPALPQLFRTVGEPRPALVHNAGLNGHIQHFPGAGDARPPNDIELRLAEGRSHLVLDHLDPGERAVGLVLGLEGLDAEL